MSRRRRPCCGAAGQAALGVLACLAAAVVEYQARNYAHALAWGWLALLVSIALVADLAHRAEHSERTMPTVSASAPTYTRRTSAGANQAPRMRRRGSVQ